LGFLGFLFGEVSWLSLSGHTFWAKSTVSIRSSKDLSKLIRGVSFGKDMIFSGGVVNLDSHSFVFLDLANQPVEWD